MKPKIFSLLLVVSVFCIFAIPVSGDGHEVTLYLFWGDGCPHCAKEKPFLEKLENKYPQLEVKQEYNQENAKLFSRMAKAYGKEARGAPTTFLGDKVWIGWTEKTTPPPRSEHITPKEENVVNLPLVGEVDLSSMSSLAATVLIAFVDGFNPCSLWVLTFLLGIVAYSGSRGKIIMVGATYLLVTALTYGLFILGVFNVFQYIGHLLWIRVVVSLIALTFAVINIKDYFWYKKGISFTIPQSYRPKIFEDIRNIMNQGQSAPAIILATATMALGVTLVELPCTAGFPVMWSGMMAAQNIVGPVFALLLFIYMLIYLLDELFVFATAALTLKMSKLEEKHGRLLKLIGGMVMLALAATFLFKPEIMNDLKGSVIIFGAAGAASLLVVLIRKLGLA